ncbi:MAG: proton-conducting transporter membrane subunit [Lachnospiraceae bacterium]
MTQILNIVGMIMILGGIIGVTGKQITKKMLGIALDVAGIILLVNAQRNNYGVFAGLELLIFALPVLIMFLILLGSVCKKNHIHTIRDLYGLRKHQPWLFALFVIIGVVLIGIPGTGTFGAYMLAVPAMITGESILSYIAIPGLLIGIILIGLQFYDLWIHMYLIKDVYDETANETEKEYKKMNKAGLVLCTAILLVICFFGVYETPVMLLIDYLNELI